MDRRTGCQHLRVVAHRGQIQVRRQHAGPGPRLQRPRPLRIPASHGRDASAHDARAEHARRPRSAIADLLPGDLVFFNTRRFANSHVGIYLGDNRFIHAPSQGGDVEIATFSAAYWQKRFNGARRLVGSVPSLAPSIISSATAAPLPMQMAPEFGDAVVGRDCRPSAHRRSGCRPSGCLRPTSRPSGASKSLWWPGLPMAATKTLWWLGAGGDALRGQVPAACAPTVAWTCWCRRAAFSPHKPKQSMSRVRARARVSDDAPE